MKFALLNPNWDFTGSTYFGCRDPHTPLELLFAAAKARTAQADEIGFLQDQADRAGARREMDAIKNQGAFLREQQKVALDDNGG